MFQKRATFRLVREKYVLYRIDDEEGREHEYESPDCFGKDRVCVGYLFLRAHRRDVEESGIAESERREGDPGNNPSHDNPLGHDDNILERALIFFVDDAVGLSLRFDPSAVL